MFSSRENRDNESLLSRDGESGGDKLWFVNPLIHSCRRNDGKERRVTIGVESAVSCTLCVDLSRQHKIFHFHPEKLRCARKRAPPSVWKLFFLPPLDVFASGVAIKMANNIIQICRSDWFYDFSSRRFVNVDAHSSHRAPLATFYSHNLIISALWPGT